MGDLVQLIGVLVSLLALVALLVGLPWLLMREQSRLEEALSDLGNDVERQDRRHAAELRAALERISALEAKVADHPAREPPPSPSTAPDEPLTMDQMIAAATDALQSAAAFDAFAARWSGQACDLWTPSAGAGPLRSDGPASRADLCLIPSTQPELAFAVPAFGLMRQLTLLTADNGRPAEERLGPLFTVRRGRHFRPIRAAEVDPQTGRLRARGEMELPLD